MSGMKYKELVGLGQVKGPNLGLELDGVLKHWSHG